MRATFSAMCTEEWLRLVVVICVLLKAGAASFSDDDCNNHVELIDARRTRRGVITSPDYPLPLNSSACFQWHISANEGDIITISFVDYDIPSRNPRLCNENSVTLSSVKTVCGTMSGVPAVYVSTKFAMSLEYRYMDPTILPGRGFNLDYIAGPSSPTRCLEGEFQCSSGPCILQKWQCNGATECTDGSDEIGCYLDTATISPPANYSCGENGFGCRSAVDAQYRCFPNHYICDKKAQCIDNKDEKSCDNSYSGCFERFTNSNGYITSQDYPDSYQDNAKCSYLVQVDKGNRIQLRILDLQLGRGDTIYIYDGISDKYSMLAGELDYRTTTPLLVVSTGDAVFIEFRANDDSSTDRGFNISYQIKGLCLPHQFHCSFGEDDCFEPEQHCDGRWDCALHGGDERGCGTCADHLFTCATTSHCYDEKDHCNGLHYCPDKSDEENCTPDKCGHASGTFLCDNRHCIYESWVCDRADDCKDNSDERHCSSVPTRKVITAAVLGSLLCALLLIVAIGATCKLHAHRMNQMLGGYARYMSPMLQIEQEIWARRSAPPLYDEAMRTSRPYEEAHREFMQAMQEALARRQQEGNPASGGDPANQATSPASPATDQSTSAPTEDDDPLIDVTSEVVTSGGGSSGDRGVSSAVAMAAAVAQEEEHASNVLITINTGAKAQWRRFRQRSRSGSNPATDESTLSDGSDSTVLSDSGLEHTPLRTFYCDTPTARHGDAASPSLWRRAPPGAQSSPILRRQRCETYLSSVGGRNAQGGEATSASLPPQQQQESLGSSAQNGVKMPGDNEVASRPDASVAPQAVSPSCVKTQPVPGSTENKRESSVSNTTVVTSAKMAAPREQTSAQTQPKQAQHKQESVRSGTTIELEEVANDESLEDDGDDDESLSITSADSAFIAQEDIVPHGMFLKLSPYPRPSGLNAGSTTEGKAGSRRHQMLGPQGRDSDVAMLPLD